MFSFDFRKKVPCFRCFMPEIPEIENNCEDDGVMSTLAGVMGTLQANEVIKTILKAKNELTSKMIVFNSYDLAFRKIKLRRNTNCINLCTKK